MLTPSYTTQHDRAEVLRWAEDAGLITIREGPVPATVIAMRPEEGYP
jgi:hypothetical protein